MPCCIHCNGCSDCSPLTVGSANELCPVRLILEHALLACIPHTVAQSVRHMYGSCRQCFSCKSAKKFVTKSKDTVKCTTPGTSAVVILLLWALTCSLCESHMVQVGLKAHNPFMHTCQAYEESLDVCASRMHSTACRCFLWPKLHLQP